MATVTYRHTQTFAKFRIFSQDETTTWNGSAMQAHGSVSNYGTNGVLTPATAAAPGGGNETVYTVTLPALAASTTYWLVPFVSTPVIGEYWPSPEWLEFTLDADGAVVDPDTQQGEIEALQAQIAALGAAPVSGSGGTNPVQTDLSLILSAGVEQSTANSYALVWTIEDYAGPAVGSLSVSLELIHIDNYNAGVMTADLTKSGAVTKPADDAIFTVQLDAADTADLETSPPDVWWNYKYKLKISYNSNVIRQVLNSCVVRA